MIVQFSDADLQKWSQFSGDYNPIHFDEVAASRVGWNEPVAHGMLAMLALKDGLDDRSNANVWRRWSASLRQPITLQSRYLTVFDEKRGRGTADFSLLAEGSKIKHIRGQYGRIELADAVRLPCAAEFNVGRAQIEHKLAEFREYFPNIRRFWVFIDAFIFYLFLKSHAGTILNVEVPEYSLRGANENNGNKATVTDYAVVHALHSVNISPALVGVPISHFVPEISYSFFGRDRIDNGESAYVILEMPVWLSGQLSLNVEMCLMIRNAGTYDHSR